jgi:hypothetical protein
MIEKKIIKPRKRTTTTIPVKPVADIVLTSSYAVGSKDLRALINIAVSVGSSKILAKSRDCSLEIKVDKTGWLKYTNWAPSRLIGPEASKNVAKR